MRDALDAHIYDAHHEHFSNLVDDALAAARVAFCSLARQQFDAPWTKARRKESC